MKNCASLFFLFSSQTMSRLEKPRKSIRYSSAEADEIRRKMTELRARIVDEENRIQQAEAELAQKESEKDRALVEVWFELGFFELKHLFSPSYTTVTK